MTPGRYVGAEEVPDDGEPFEQKIERLTAQFEQQFIVSGWATRKLSSAHDGEECRHNSVHRGSSIAIDRSGRSVTIKER